MSARPDRAFTLVEVLAAITLFTVVFLSGTAGITRLLLTQNLNYQKTVAGTAAMLLTDWHVRRAINQGAGALDFIANTTIGANQIVSEKLSPCVPAWSNVTFTGGEFIPTGALADRVFAFSTPTVTDTLTGAVIDLSEYQSLLMTVSQPSAAEADSHIGFREVSFWYMPAKNLADALVPAYTAANPTSARFVGRYLVPDRYVP